ncbi:CynX/NimT family MFS transporter [Streptomyces benahoarensis]|uniref:MFS transporter n=1 Tax=Streptomyces benahoarensis TaxID=2595054 RepID=A0A553Y129_9ACTN|nr:MFS transporter [Streptomyces benahoarensis]TSB22713.1 MFS transporter [Streptomyces benahoarensis]
MAEDDLATLRAANRPAPDGAPIPATDRTADNDRPTPTTPTTAPRWLNGVVLAGLVLAALNLRPAITSLGALMEEVRAGLGMSGTVAGLLTSVPALCFAAFGIAAPRLARRRGPGTVVCAGMAAIAVGVAVRPFTGGTAGFVTASALALAGIAVSNVLLPVIIKNWFPDRVGPMTGIYSMALALGTSLAAATTVPLTSALGGWRPGLAVWAALAVAAVLPWALVLRRRATTPVPGAAHRTEDRPIRIAASPTAWSLAVFFGLQATAAYITMGWMPQIFRDAGVSAGTAGVLLAVTMALGVPLSFVLPRLATRMRHQGPLAAGLGLCGLAGYTGLWLAPASGAWLWALLMGVSNCAFPLALTMIGMRATSAAGVVKLSAFAQSVGYLISLPGPLLVGALYQHSGGWGIPIALMAGLMVPQIAVGVLAGRDRRIEDET